MGYLSSDLYQIIAKSENTIGTDAVPTATDNDTPLYGVEATVETGFDDRTATPASGDHAAGMSTPGAQQGKIKAQVFLSKPATFATESGYGKFLKACGLSAIAQKQAITAAAAAGQKNVTVTDGTKFFVGQVVTLSSTLPEQATIASIAGNVLTMTANIVTACTTSHFVATGWSYRNNSGADESGLSVYTVDVERGGNNVRTRKFKGCMGNGVVKADSVGKAISVDFDYSGSFIGESAGSKFSRSWSAQEKKVNFVNTPVTIGGVAVKANSFTLDFGTKVSGVATSGGNGFDFFAVLDRKASLKLSILQNAVFAGDDKIGDAFASTTVPVIITGQGYSVTIPNAQLLSPADSVKEGLRAWELSFNCTGGDDMTAAGTGYQFEITIGNKC